MNNLKNMKAIKQYSTILHSRMKSIGRRVNGRRCQTVGMEDDRHPGKLRKFECCPVSSKSKKKSKLAKGVAFIGGDEDDDSNDQDDDYVPDDDFLDDDDDDDQNNDHPHDDPSNPEPDQHDHHASSPPSPPQHDQSYDYVSDDEFVDDATGIFILYMCIRHHSYKLATYLFL